MCPKLIPVAFLTALAVFPAAARQDSKDQAENPYYKFWSRSKVGASVEFKETNKAPARPDAEADEEVKVVRQTLVELTPEKAVVQTVVIEGEVFGFVETAPTKHIYPARMSKAVLDELLQETGAKGSDSTVGVGGKDVKATLLAGTIKKGDEETAFQLWLTDEVPGGIAKRVRTTRVKGDVVAVTTVEVLSFKKE